MKHRGQDAPSYSEAQATAWLAWLARGMQQHGQTLFLIEQLQPSWLSTRRQRWVYILTSRLIWGIVVGLIFGLIAGLMFGLSLGLFGGLRAGLRSGLVSGLIGGLVIGWIDAVRWDRNRSRPAQNASVPPLRIIQLSLLFALVSGLISGLLYGLAGGLFGGLAGGQIGEVWNGLSAGLVFGLIFGPFWVLRGIGRNPRNEIQTVETIRFAGTALPKGIVNGLLIGLIFGPVVGLIVGLIFGLEFGLVFGPALGLQAGLIFGVVFGLSFGLIFGLIGGLLSCFRPGIRELKTIPNQGIRLSLRSGSLMGSVGGLALGLIVGLIGEWTNGLAFGALAGLCIGLWYGGLDVIQHYIVRILLWRAGSMPRDYARLLDYAAEELNFLQKVGGGYMFVHRYLLEYFAAMDLPGQAVATDGDTASQPMVTTGESV